MIEAWKTWQHKSAPFLLDGDRDVILSPTLEHRVVIHCGWDDLQADANFCCSTDRRLHVGLLPQPFIGDVRNAAVYVLFLNPGLGPHDYFGEYRVPEYRAALLANLRQEWTKATVPFLFLDPRHSWHGGFAWWNGKLGAVIERLQLSWGVTLAEARRRVAQRLASIELVPYHSSSFAIPGGTWRRLRSVQLARTFVTDYVRPRVRDRRALVIVARKAREWSLPAIPGVISYNAMQARGAHLTPTSAGGRAMLEHLLAVTDTG